MGVRVLNRRRVLINQWGESSPSPMDYHREYEAELRRKGSYWVIGQIDDIRDQMRGPFESRRDATKQMKALLAQYPTVVDDYGDKVERYLSVFQSKPSRNPGKIAAEMSAAEINRRLDQLDKLDSQVSHDFIEAGRGHERPSEYLKQTDPLSMRARTIWDEKQKLYIEVEKRAGPGMRRLPRGFGPIRGY